RPVLGCLVSTPAYFPRHRSSRCFSHCLNSSTSCQSQCRPIAVHSNGDLEKSTAANRSPASVRPKISSTNAVRITHSTTPGIPIASITPVYHARAWYHLPLIPMHWPQMNTDLFSLSLDASMTQLRGRLEQFHRIAVGVFDLDLAAARSGLHVVSKMNARRLQLLDPCRQVAHLKNEPIPP